jgi:K+-sensing histidine kinase KdpD
MEKECSSSVMENEVERLTKTIAKLHAENEEWKGKALSMISHEFKTPLSTIRLSANHLMRYRDRMQHNAIDEKLRAILHQTDHLVYSITNLTTLKFNADKVIASKKEIDIASFFVKLKNEMERKFNKKGSIILDFALGKKEIQTDENLLLTIFSNILNNAMIFSPETPAIQLLVKGSEENMEVTVKDHGVGIDAQDLPKIFDSFYRGSNSKGIDGVGLGLSMAKKATETLHGTICVTSEPGQGATFSIVIPK